MTSDRRREARRVFMEVADLPHEENAVGRNAHDHLEDRGQGGMLERCHANTPLRDCMASSDSARLCV